MARTSTSAVIDHAEIIRTPATLGQHVGISETEPWAPHEWIMYAQSRVMAALAKPGRRIIIINVPPQQGKSTFVYWLLCWYLGINPTHQAIFVAYNEEYAASWGEKVRAFFEQHGKAMFGIGVHKTKTAAAKWLLANGRGGMLSAGILGGITGNPGHLIVIDDVIKTMEDAMSKATKEKHIGEWDGSIKSRFQLNTKVVITATRWAEDDLSGEIIRRSKLPDYNGPPVEVIRLPAFAEPALDEFEQMTDEDLAEWRDVLGRERGEHLEGQHDREFFLEMMPPSTDPYRWNALYQQNPTARTGGMFPSEMWNYYDPAKRPPFVAEARVWDLASTQDGGDYTVGVRGGIDADGRIYIHPDLVRKRLNPANVRAEVLAAAVRDGRSIPLLIERERSGAGKTVVSWYQEDAALRGWEVREAHADGTKEQRAVPYSAKQNVGMVFLPEGVLWTKEWKDEHRQMMGDGRKPRHDDQIDVGSYLVLELMSHGGSSRMVDPMESDQFARAATNAMSGAVVDVDELLSRLGDLGEAQMGGDAVDLAQLFL